MAAKRQRKHRSPLHDKAHKPPRISHSHLIDSLGYEGDNMEVFEGKRYNGRNGTMRQVERINFVDFAHTRRTVIYQKMLPDGTGSGRLFFEGYSKFTKWAKSEVP